MLFTHSVHTYFYLWPHFVINYPIISDVGRVITQWESKFKLGIYPGIYTRWWFKYPKLGYFQFSSILRHFLICSWSVGQTRSETGTQSKHRVFFKYLKYPNWVYTPINKYLGSVFYITTYDIRVNYSGLLNHFWSFVCDLYSSSEDYNHFTSLYKII